MRYFGKPRIWLLLIVITWPFTIFVAFPILGILTLLTAGMFRGMDLLEDFINWQMSFET